MPQVQVNVSSLTPEERAAARAMLPSGGTPPKVGTFVGGPPPRPTPQTTTGALDDMDRAVLEGTRGLGGLPPLPAQPKIGVPTRPDTLTQDWLGRPFHPPTIPGVEIAGVGIPAVPGYTRGPVSADTAIGASRAVLPTVGSTIGGAIGARGGFKTAVAASGAGEAAGELASMALETSMGRPPLLTDVPKRLGVGVATGAASEVGGRVITRFLSPFAKYATGKAAQLGLQAKEYLQGHLTPAQQIDSNALAILENLVEGSMFGSGRHRTFLQEQQALLRQKSQDILDQFGPRATLEEAGEAVNDAARATIDTERRGLEWQAAAARGEQRVAEIAADTTRGRLQGRTGRSQGAERTGQLWQELQTAAHDTARRGASALYDQVDEMSKGVRVSLQPMRDFVEQEIEKRGQLGLALRGGKTASTVKAVDKGTAPPDVEDLEKAAGTETARAALRGLAPDDPRMQILLDAMADSGVASDALAEGVTFRQAHEIRSALGKIIREASTGKRDSSLRGLAIQLQDRIDKAMTTAADDEVTGVPGLRAAYDTATSTWKQMAKTFEDSVLADVIDKEPRLVVQTLIKAGRVEEIQAAKQALSKSPEAWKAVQAEHLETLLAGTNGKTWATGDQLLSRLQKLSPETLDAVYGAEGKLDLEALGAAMQRADVAGASAEALAKQAGQVKDAVPPPYRVVSQIIKPGSVKEIERMRQMVGAEQWKKVQSAHAASLLQGDTPESIVSGKELMKRLTKLGKDTVAAAYPRGADDGLWQLARVMSYVQRDRPHIGKMYIQLAQAGAVTAAIGLGGSPGIGASIIITPAILSRIIASPTGRKWLTTGLGNAGTEAKARAASNLVGFLVREGLVSERGPSSASSIATPGGRQGGPGTAGAGNAPPGNPRGGG